MNVIERLAALSPETIRAEFDEAHSECHAYSRQLCVDVSKYFQISVTPSRIDIRLAPDTSLELRQHSPGRVVVKEKYAKFHNRWDVPPDEIVGKLVTKLASRAQCRAERVYRRDSVWEFQFFPLDTGVATFYRYFLSTSRSEVVEQVLVSVRETPETHWCINRDQYEFYQQRTDNIFKTAKAEHVKLYRVFKRGSRVAFGTKTEAWKHFMFLKQKQAQHLRHTLNLIECLHTNPEIRCAAVEESELYYRTFRVEKQSCVKIK